VFDYMRQLNTFAQFGPYHVDTDEKKANLFHNGLTIPLQDRVVLSTNLSYNELASAAIDQKRLMNAVAEADEKKRNRMMTGSSTSGGSSIAPAKSTAWCIPHLGVSCADHNSSRIGAITHNTNNDNSSRNNHNNNNNSNNSSSTVLLLHHRSSMQSGHHSRFPPTTFCATTVERWDTSLATASCPSKATHHELWHSWSINKRVLHHGLAVLATPPWMRF
jgi:hypothetical protein